MTTEGREPRVDATARARLLDRVFETLRELYIFPAVAAEMETYVRGRAAEGAYDDLATGDRLCEALTRDLQAVSRDKHLRLRYHPEPQPPREGDMWLDPEVIAEYLAGAAQDNYGVQRVERLAGNVGCLQLTSIDEAEYTAPTLSAAMAVLANTSALVLDLRRNNGGAPSGVAFLCSYFFPPEPVHLNDIHCRVGEFTQQYWTLPHVPGERYLLKPVYVLTSDKTFSGAEELTYNLQHLGRATVVGETTAGGANPVEARQLDPHWELRTPTCRAINPVTGTNWEGVGVAPDIATPKEEALRVAHADALEKVLEGLGDHPAGPRAGLATEARAELAKLTGEAG
jgi:hypothetical protein